MSEPRRQGWQVIPETVAQNMLCPNIHGLAVINNTTQFAQSLHEEKGGRVGRWSE